MKGNAGGGGRKLLFVTDEVRLAQNIGAGAVAQALAKIREAGQRLLSGDGPSLALECKRTLARNRDIDGVVLLGGVDVVPSRIAFTVPAELRQTAGARQLQMKERDRLQVWSDDVYGDLDDNGVPEVPVSRIPDGKDPGLVLRALTHRGVSKRPGAVRGVRNVKRPFADLVFKALDLNGAMMTCESAAAGLPPYPLQSDTLYLMLHGHWREPGVFRGEDDDGYPEALSANEIPDPAPDVVFCGCCYGALSATEAARDAKPNANATGLRTDQSIALTCLRKGTNAFVGCTAVHYSPDKAPFRYLGEPMHRYFWEEMAAGEPPSRALFRAKVRYAQGIPHLAGSSPELAIIEHKILRQFTCLGLGW